MCARPVHASPEMRHVLSGDADADAAGAMDVRTPLRYMASPAIAPASRECVVAAIEGVLTPAAAVRRDGKVVKKREKGNKTEASRQ